MNILVILVYTLLNVFLFISGLFNHNMRRVTRVLCLVGFVALNAVFIYGMLNWWFL